MPSGGTTQPSAHNVTPQQLIGMFAQAVAERLADRLAFPDVLKLSAEAVYNEIQKAPVKKFEVVRVMPNGQRVTQHIGLTEALTELSDLMQMNNALLVHLMTTMKELTVVMSKNNEVCRKILKQNMNEG